MSNIGQLRRSEISTYTTSLDYTMGEIANDESIVTFYDKYMILSNAISSSSSYYLKFTVYQSTDYTQSFNIKLKNSESEEDSEYQSVRTLSVKQGTDSITFEIIFTPNSTYNQIIFELSRTALDFSYINNEDTSGRLMIIEVNQFQEIINVISSYLSKYSGLTELTKIGIQGPPGLLFELNGEEMRIGRTGIYELYYDEITVTSLGFIIKESSFTQDGKDYFIMDFKY